MRNGFKHSGTDFRLVSGRSAKDIFRDEQGITTVGMAIAIFLSLAMIFSGAQVYRVLSSSADIQNVADSCALAAQNEVADFYVTANVCDAAILTMTLTSGLSYGLGIVSACVPALNSLSIKFVEFGEKVREARDKFSKSAKSGLEKYQSVLPFLASVKALNVARANNVGLFEADYFAISVLVPQSGKAISLSQDNTLDAAGSSVSSGRDELAQESQKADEAVAAANEAKQRAYSYDCGNQPGNCMYERANRLSSIGGSENPLYSSVDAWSFDVGIRRARAYYEARLADVSNVGGTVKEQAKAALNKRFYEYALSELAGAYATETDTDFDFYLPHFFKNNAEFRQTSLYLEAIYPVSDVGGQPCMHAWSGCPNAAEAYTFGSPAELDGGGYVQCELCEFEFVSISQVASATTNVATGFEYHYERFRQAAEDYKKAKDEAKPAMEAAKNKAGELFESLKSVFASAASARIEVSPPGLNGCVAIVVNKATSAADAGVEGLFVAGGTTLGSRAAVSAATLVSDTSEDGASIIDSLLDGFELQGVADGAGRILLGAWSGLLKVYTGGQKQLEQALSSALGGMQTNTTSGLGTWAAGVLGGVIEAAGLQGADISVKKSVLVNTSRVAGEATSGFGVQYMKIKKSVLKTSSSSGDALGTLLEASGIGGWISGVESSLDVAQIELPFGSGATIPISVLLPDGVKTSIDDLYTRAKEAFKSATGAIGGGSSWQ